MVAGLTQRKLEIVPGKALQHLREFGRDVRAAFPDNLVRIVLFGSRARGDAKRDSDYDVAIFMKELNDRQLIDHKLADLAFRHILAGIHIRPVSVPYDFLERSPRIPLAATISREGILVQ